MRMNLRAALVPCAGASLTGVVRSAYSLARHSTRAVTIVAPTPGPVGTPTPNKEPILIAVEVEQLPHPHIASTFARSRDSDSSS